MPRLCIHSRTAFLFLTIGIFISLTSHSIFAQTPLYWVTDMGSLGGMRIQPERINKSGQVVGYTQLGIGEARPFYWDSINGLQFLGITNGQYADDINDFGHVVGSANENGFLWKNSTTVLLNFMHPRGINNIGQICGYGNNYTAVVTVDMNGNILSESRMDTPNGPWLIPERINDSGQVTGVAVPADGSQHAFLWQKETGVTYLGTLVGDTDSWPFAINSSGDVVGQSTYDDTTGRHFRAFLWHAGTMTNLGTLYGGRTQAHGINASGQVVGYSTGAFIWQNGIMYDLNNMIPSGSDWFLYYATDINDHGQIVGEGWHDGNHAYLLTPIDYIQPNSGGNLGEVSVTILRPSLQVGASLKLTAPNQPDIPGYNVQVWYDPDYQTTVMQATFDLTNQPPGPRSVVINQVNTNLTLSNTFTVERINPFPIEIDIVGRNQVAVGYAKTYEIVLTNKSNVDLIGVPVFFTAARNSVRTISTSNASIDPSIPLLIGTSGDWVVPLIVSRVPANGTVEIPLQLTFDASANLYAWTSPLYHQMYRANNDTSWQPQVFDSFKTVVREVFLRASGRTTIRNENKLNQAVTTALTQLRNTINAAYQNSNVAEPLVSLTQLVKQAVTYLAIFEGVQQLPDLTATTTEVFLQLPTVEPLCFGREWDISLFVEAGSSDDPNAVEGPVRAFRLGWIDGEQPLTFNALCENKPDAFIDAYTILTQVHFWNAGAMDLPRLNLGAVTMAEFQSIQPQSAASPIAGLREFNHTRDLEADRQVSVNSSLDLDSGDLTYLFTTPQDQDKGILAPGKEASMVFTVAPKRGLPSGTVVAVWATITFDFNDPIDTDILFFQIDNDYPTSQVMPLNAVQNTPQFLVRWNGEDPYPGSGLSGYTIYVSDNDGPFVPWLTNVLFNEATFHGQTGHRYRFYTIATDNVGHKEAAPAQPDTETRVVENLSVNISGTITLQESVNRAQPLTFEFRPTDGSAVFTRTLTLSSNGGFSLSNIPARLYKLAIKGSKWLRRTIDLDASSNVSGLSVTLLGGDATGDNIVDVEDLATLITSFDADPFASNWDGGKADFNCDQVVSVDDLDLLIRNFDVQGDP